MKNVLNLWAQKYNETKTNENDFTNLNVKFTNIRIDNRGCNKINYIILSVWDVVKVRKRKKNALLLKIFSQEMR